MSFRECVHFGKKYGDVFNRRICSNEGHQKFHLNIIQTHLVKKQKASLHHYQKINDQNFL
jgi:hypothetical protein